MFKTFDYQIVVLDVAGAAAAIADAVKWHKCVAGTCCPSMAFDVYILWTFCLSLSPFERPNHDRAQSPRGHTIFGCCLYKLHSAKRIYHFRTPCFVYRIFFTRWTSCAFFVLMFFFFFCCIISRFMCFRVFRARWKTKPYQFSRSHTAHTGFMFTKLNQNMARCEMKQSPFWRAHANGGQT